MKFKKKKFIFHGIILIRNYKSKNFKIKNKSIYFYFLGISRLKSSSRDFFFKFLFKIKFFLILPLYFLKNFIKALVKIYIFLLKQKKKTHIVKLILSLIKYFDKNNIAQFEKN